MVMRIERLPAFRPSFRSIFDLERGIDNMFDSLVAAGFRPVGDATPALDIAEQDDATVVVAELPGVTKDRISITFENDLLTISGERKATDLPDNSRWIRSETRRGSFSRSVRLPHPVKTDAVSAELANGILRVVLPKAEEARPREISIQ
jgi:HSP20 family protein